MPDTAAKSSVVQYWFAASSVLVAVFALWPYLRRGRGTLNPCKKELQQGLDCYDPENRVFPQIVTKARRGQPLIKREVLLILKWKLNRTKSAFSETVSDANMTKINQAICIACKSSREVEALKALDDIPEIGLAVATAILTVCYPKKYTILDWRVLEVLNLFPSTLLHTDWTASTYFSEYLPAVEQRKKQWCCTLREADKGLWGLSVAKDIDQVIANSRIG